VNRIVRQSRYASVCFGVAFWRSPATTPSQPFALSAARMNQSFSAWPTAWRGNICSFATRWQRRFEQTPTDFGHYYCLGRYYGSDLDDSEEAVRWFHEAVSRNPSFEPARLISVMASNFWAAPTRLVSALREFDRLRAVYGLQPR
jgi:hypothetical protein